jgi:hypothetical protein
MSLIHYSMLKEGHQLKGLDAIDYAILKEGCSLEDSNYNIILILCYLF